MDDEHENERKHHRTVNSSWVSSGGTFGTRNGSPSYASGLGWSGEQRFTRNLFSRILFTGDKTKSGSVRITLSEPTATTAAIRPRHRVVLSFLRLQCCRSDSIPPSNPSGCIGSVEVSLTWILLTSTSSPNSWWHD